MERITLKDIAAHFNVSAAAISKALNDLPGVSEELRSEIKKFAGENNYVPNMFGRGLKGNQLKVLGVMISDNTNPVYSKQIKIIEAEANKRGYNIVLCNSDESIAKEQLHLKMMLEKNVNGIIAVPADSSSTEHFQKVIDLGVPLVFLNRVVYDCNASVFKADHREGARIATEYLIKRGYKKIVHFTVDQSVSTVYEKIQGFRETLSRHDRECDGDCIFFCSSFDRGVVYNEVMRYLAKNNDIDAVFAFNDSLALSVLRAANTLGIAVPGKLAILGYDETDYNDFCNPALSSVAQNLTQISIDAVEHLVNEIEGNERCVIVREALPMGIIERQST